MNINAEFIVNASIGEVWDLLLDPKCLRVCIPGCESITAKNEEQFSGVVGVKVGPIKTRFKMEIIIIEKQPPRLLVAKAVGEDLFKAGTFTQKNRLSLQELSTSKTKVTVTSEFNPSGRIATFGERVFRAKARKIQDEFLASFETYLDKEGRAE
jgi:carbon monoxide dehydrogenase subunit G